MTSILLFPCISNVKEKGLDQSIKDAFMPFAFSWEELVYKILFLVFTLLGAAISMDAAVKFSDAVILALVFPNMIGLFFYFQKVKEELK
jgi:Na+/alanine symporter